MVRKALIAILALSAFSLVLLVYSLNTLVEKNRESIKTNLEKHLGRSLTFENLRLDLKGRLALSANNLSIAEDPYFAATPFIQSRELTMPLRLLPLLWGKIVIKKFILDEPEIQIIRNEAGNLNILSRGWPIGEGDRSLLGPGLEVADGKVYYIDRWVEEPLEIRIRNLEMDLKGPGLTGVSRIYIAANLLAAQGQNVTIEGRIGPFSAAREWNRYPLDLYVEIDPLPFPQLTQALPYLEKIVPDYLGITGPLEFRTRVRGTPERPRIENLTLKGPFFGSRDNNTVVKGKLDYSKSGAWKDGEVKLTASVDPATLDRLRNIPFLRRLLPAALTSEGPLSVETEVEGSWENLKAHTLIKAGESKISYGNWLKKEPGIAARIDLIGRYQKERLLFEESTLTLHNMKLKFSGSLEKTPERLLRLNLQSKRLSLSGWDQLLLPLSSYRAAGNLQWDLSIQKNLGLPDDPVTIRGALNLADVGIKERKTGHRIDKIKARLSFEGRRAKIENLSLRLDSSDLTAEAAMPDLSQPLIYYTLHSPQLSPADLTNIVGEKEDRIKNLLSRGEVQIQQGLPILKGDLFSPEGMLGGIPYRDLRGEIAWSPNELTLRNFSFQALNGIFRINGAWATTAEDLQHFTLDSNLEAMDVGPLLVRILPGFKNSIEGRLNLKGRLMGGRRNGSAVPESLEGEGAARIRAGSLKNFNLVDIILSNVEGLPAISNLLSPDVSTRLEPILKRRDTPFDTLAATFTVEKGRLRTEDLFLSTSDYDVSGEGWINFDNTTKWDADLIMSREISEMLLQEHKNARYLLDRNGRLSIPLRIEGVLPDLQAKPDLKRLSRTIQKGLLGRDKNSTPDPKRDGKEKK